MPPPLTCLPQAPEKARLAGLREQKAGNVLLGSSALQVGPGAAFFFFFISQRISHWASLSGPGNVTFWLATYGIPGFCLDSIVRYPHLFASWPYQLVWFYVSGIIEYIDYIFSCGGAWLVSYSIILFGLMMASISKITLDGLIPRVHRAQGKVHSSMTGHNASTACPLATDLKGFTFCFSDMSVAKRRLL